MSVEIFFLYIGCYVSNPKRNQLDEDFLHLNFLIFLKNILARLRSFRNYRCN